MPTDKTAPARRGNPNWTKGVSGNPGGRPRAIVEVQELARLETAASIRALVRVRDFAEHPASGCGGRSNRAAGSWMGPAGAVA